MDYIKLAQEYIADLYPIIDYDKPPVRLLPPGTILGTWQYSIPHKKRYILARDLELATGVLPGDVARAWIRDEYKLPLKRRKEQLTRSYQVPLHAVRGKYGQCGYVDIEKAYVHILSMGYNVEYLYGKYLGAEARPVPQQIIQNKLCYSLAVSASATPLSNITIVGKDTVFQSHPFNVFSNPCLFNLALDTLNGIGATVLAELGDHCHYINTDGFIVDEAYIDRTIEIIREWGFNARLKHYGDCEIRGTASYRIGTKQSRIFDMKMQDFSGKFMPLDEAKWLLRRWALWEPTLTGFYKSVQNSNISTSALLIRPEIVL